MRKFFLKSLFFLTPFLVIIAGFFLTDPFRVLYQYEDYSKEMIVIPNRDFVSTEVYKQNRKKQHYDSFILGSSRTIGFRTWDWKKHLGENAVPFVFDASAETIFGINSKVKYLDEKGDTIKNALVLICRNATFSLSGDNSGHLLKKHPEVAKTSWFRFYSEFLKSYFEVKFLAAYYDYEFTGIYKEWMGSFVEPREIKYDPVSNDVTIVDLDGMLKKDAEDFYVERADVFYDREKSKEKSGAIISEEQEEMLVEIKNIFDRHGTCYEIILSPLYDQIPFHANDLEILQNIFGHKKVHNYCGVNKYTEAKENYYETSHFRPKVGAAIMEEIYPNDCTLPLHEDTANHTNL